jgi:thymidine kinase
MSSSGKPSSYLEIILGPMFSGKTSKLLEIYKQYTFCNIPVAVINHSYDTRYHETMLSTHDKIMIPCIQTTNIGDIWNYCNLEEAYNEDCSKHMKLRLAEVILINEGQFFEDLYPIVLQMLDDNKKVYICGLDGDFDRKKFGSLLDLIPLCDKVTKLTSLCSLCRDGTHGIFSLRVTRDKQQTLVGSDNYIPVCRKCYNEKNPK